MLKQCAMAFYTEVYVSTGFRTQFVQLIQNISFGGKKFALILYMLQILSKDLFNQKLFILQKIVNMHKYHIIPLFFL